MNMEPFSFVEKTVGAEKSFHLFDNVRDLSAARTADHDLQYIDALRQAYPGFIVTACPESNVPLRAFAYGGNALCELDTKTDSFASWRGYAAPARRSDKGALAEATFFAKYHYKWNEEDFILYLVGPVQYVLKERRESEDHLGPSTVTDSLIRMVGDWKNTIAEVVWVYDQYWEQSRTLWEEVQRSSWDNVILDEGMKHELTRVAHRFFDQEDVYRKLGVPWKRGLMFYGPPGNGKTISIRALMHSLYNREKPIPTLYVRSAPFTWDIRQVFERARAQSPCMLILEDVETIVTPETRSYFFNEMDGLENNDGLFIVASTNFLDRLDPGLSKRPSRFDRKYLFPIPNEHERMLYCEFWRQKLKSNDSVVFPEKLCSAMAHITKFFSFAYLQECFVGTMLRLLREDDEDSLPDAMPFDSDNDELDDYRLWVIFKEQADILRRELDNQDTKKSQFQEWCNSGDSVTEAAFEPTSYEQPSRQCHCCHHSRKPNPKAATIAVGQKAQNQLVLGLPYGDGKHSFMNSAALELRHYDG